MFYFVFIENHWLKNTSDFYGHKYIPNVKKKGAHMYFRNMEDIYNTVLTTVISGDGFKGGKLFFHYTFLYSLNFLVEYLFYIQMKIK